ncbi:unnamed protein product [Pleuronectes platessa]|uniref:Uncharacterized protein n=1 Tax=Pleuronectes platessa TaxID=8262 RepID=A0A9N7Z6Y6_PLEPL|nr:unnamed protein product [Pleuronectes platessa]
MLALADHHSQVLSVGSPPFRRVVRKTRAARKALRGAAERHGEGVPRWRRRSYLFVSVKTEKHTLAFSVTVEPYAQMLVRSPYLQDIESLLGMLSLKGEEVSLRR